MYTRTRLIIATIAGVSSLLFYWIISNPLKEFFIDTTLGTVWKIVHILPFASIIVGWYFGVVQDPWPAIEFLSTMFIQWFLLAYLATKLFFRKQTESLENSN